jgi:ankyrin repeat protein
MNICNKDGSSPFLVASSEGHAGILNLLLTKSGIDVNVLNLSNNSALGVATALGHTACNQLLTAYPGVKRISSANSFFNY